MAIGTLFHQITLIFKSNHQFITNFKLINVAVFVSR